MKKLLFTSMLVLGLVFSTFTPAQAAKKIGAAEGPVDGVDCPVYSVAASLQKFNLQAEPLNLGYGAAIGEDKAPQQSCETAHRLRVSYYLFLLPIGGPRTLIATDNGSGFCNDCTRVQSFSSAVALPGIYQVIGDYYVDDVQVNSVSTQPFLYVPLLGILKLGDIPNLTTLPTLP